MKYLSKKMTRLLFPSLLIITLVSCGSENSTGPTLPSDLGVAGDGTLENTLEYIRDQYNLPALGAMLIRGEEVVEMGAVGLRAIGFSEKVTIADRWHIGSLTKAMTATLAARLVERGNVSWDTTIADVFPDLIGSIRAEYVDVRLDELLHHIAGLPVDFTRIASFPSSRTDPAPMPVQRRRWAAELLTLEPETQRGTYLYANAGYIVAGSMLEEITGESWEDLMRREVFAPLSMESSGFGAPGSRGSRSEPWGHRDLDNGWQPLEPGPNADNPAALGPAGTVYTTFDDFADYIIAHLAGARGKGGLVSAESYIKLHTPAPGTTYALGWGVGTRSWAGGRVLQHSGSNTAWMANLWLGPDKNYALLAVSNAGGEEAFQANETVILALNQRFDAAFGQF